MYLCKLFHRCKFGMISRYRYTYIYSICGVWEVFENIEYENRYLSCIYLFIARSEIFHYDVENWTLQRKKLSIHDSIHGTEAKERFPVYSERFPMGYELWTCFCLETQTCLDNVFAKQIWWTLCLKKVVVERLISSFSRFEIPVQFAKTQRTIRIPATLERVWKGCIFHVSTWSNNIQDNLSMYRMMTVKLTLVLKLKLQDIKKERERESTYRDWHDVPLPNSISSGDTNMMHVTGTKPLNFMSGQNLHQGLWIAVVPPWCTIMILVEPVGWVIVVLKVQVLVVWYWELGTKVIFMSTSCQIQLFRILWERS